MNKEQIADLVSRKLENTGNFLVEVKTLPGKIAVFIDHPEGVKLDMCIEVSRFLHQELDGTELFNKNELEVSSPGMDEPFKVLRQYQIHTDEEVSVVTFDGMKRLGLLKGVTESGIELDEIIEKKVNRQKQTLVTTHQIPFAMIKETKLNYSLNKLIK